MSETAASYPLDPAERRVGTSVGGKWTLNRLLGVGGMAAVYEATHRNGATAAIKLFPFGVTASAELAERLLREGYLANKIGHSAVVRVLDDHIDYEEEHAYLVMELLRGETARDRVERAGPLSPLEAIDLMIVVSDCLRAAHERGVIHRDIKPENLFITRDGELKVLDFGVARALDSRSTLTKSGAALGTPAYMSPEQARGRHGEITCRADIYSAGATLLYLLSAQMLHEGESAQELMVRAAWTPPAKAKARCPGLPDSIAAVIDEACAFEPEHRYANASAFGAALQAVRAELEASPSAYRPITECTPAPSTPLPSRQTTTAPRLEALDETLVPRPRDPTTWLVGSLLTAAIIAGIAFVYPAANERAKAPSAARTEEAEPITRATLPLRPARNAEPTDRKRTSPVEPVGRVVAPPPFESPLEKAEPPGAPRADSRREMSRPESSPPPESSLSSAPLSVPAVPTGRDVGY